jgi:hypothetical protein
MVFNSVGPPAGESNKLLESTVMSSYARKHVCLLYYVKITQRNVILHNFNFCSLSCYRNSSFLHNCNTFWSFSRSDGICMANYLHIVNQFKINQSQYWNHTKIIELCEKKGLLERPRCRREDNIKMDLKEIRCKVVVWIQVAQDRVWWQVLVETNIDYFIPNKKVGNFFTS